ncbi:MAG: hypothetical protein JWL72_2203 [Ilumatobacteraceae bacterium]|nr:hypothetical protein [Ilumatobacteraceae bacterium]MCU1388865.1 hypothetical protein [Ilumatobacteraceae bacterium]
MAESSDPPILLDALAAEVTAERRKALHAIHVLEYALTAPAPRRHRTWIHRVIVAVEALHATLHDQMQASESIGLLDEIALTHPEHLARIDRLREDVLDLTIAVASLREQVEPDPTIDVNPDDVRDRLATITRQFRQHQAAEADLVYQATGIELDRPNRPG